MATTTAFDAFHDRLMAAWTTTPIVFENDRYDPADAPEPFVFVEIVGSDFSQETFGAPQENQFLEQGFTYLHVMVPSFTGSRQARSYANLLLNLFREQVTNGVFIQSMSLGAGEPGRDFPNYWAFTATLQWYRRDITNLAP